MECSTISSSSSTRVSCHGKIKLLRLFVICIYLNEYCHTNYEDLLLHLLLLLFSLTYYNSTVNRTQLSFNKGHNSLMIKSKWMSSEVYHGFILQKASVIWTIALHDDHFFTHHVTKPNYLFFADMPTNNQ